MNQIVTRDVLLEAARELFVSSGFHAASTRAIAERAGVNLAAIQYHFGSKEKLFIATIQSIWGSECSHSARDILEHSAADADTAAAILGAFVACFLDELLHPVGDQPCRIMFRELFAETEETKGMVAELVTLVADEFIRPFDSRLLVLLGLLFPQHSETELQFLSNSLVGQCFFYLTHGPFLKRVRGIDYSEDEHCQAAIKAILQFTLATCPSAQTSVPIAQTAAIEFYVNAQKDSVCLAQ